MIFATVSERSYKVALHRLSVFVEGLSAWQGMKHFRTWGEVGRDFREFVTAMMHCSNPPENFKRDCRLTCDACSFIDLSNNPISTVGDNMFTELGNAVQLMYVQAMRLSPTATQIVCDSATVSE
jgi:hypothetical protein